VERLGALGPSRRRGVGGPAPVRHPGAGRCTSPARFTSPAAGLADRDGGLWRRGTRLGCGRACATLAGMSIDSRPSAADTRAASLVPGKPSLDGIEEKWSRRWEEGRVVQV
jgi:hypothetical protein